MDYQKIYNQLVEKARRENRAKGQGTYYEAHHIIPKCLGGEGRESQWRTHPNIILLTAKEHFEAHHYLTKIHPDNSKLVYAFWAMCVLARDHQERDYFGVLNFAELYEEARSKQSEAMSRFKTGKRRSQETIDKITVANIGKKLSPETRSRMSAARRGKHNSAEVVAKKHKPVSQYTLDGVWIRDWDGVVLVERALLIKSFNIVNCLKGRQRSAGGFVWKYKS